MTADILSAGTLPAGTTFGVQEIAVGEPGIRIPREPSIHFDPRELHRIMCFRIMAREAVDRFVRHPIRTEPIFPGLK
ncbi:MAG TPA: hypothetical protein VK465_07085 [Fibrobacteria bacterium]|nr:hypothetical protein [Fibrobacteria bacterium]